MKKLFVALFVAAIAPLAHGQYASPEAQKSPEAASAGAADQSAVTTQGGSEATKVKNLLGERNCIQETGTRIVRKGTCVNTMGQAYGETAIERTGTYDTGVALQRLSPAIQVQGR